MTQTHPSTTQLLAYGLPGLPLAVLSLPLVVYLPTLYTQTYGLSLLAVGLALLLARLFDVVSDVLIGSITDRVFASGGSRKLLIALGVPLLLFGIEQLFAPADTVSFASLLLWSLLAYLGWTLIAVPYYAWGADLSNLAHTRTQLAASREAMTLLGVAAVIFIPALLGISDQPAIILENVTTVIWLLLPITVLIALLHVPESLSTKNTAGVSELSGTSAQLSAFASLKSNRTMQRVISAYLLSSIANALPATLFIFYVTHVLAAQKYIGVFLGLYFISGILALPAWIALSRRHGKVRAWSLAMLLASIAFAGAPWLAAGDLFAYALICIFTGIAYGADLALPASLQADMVDLDRRYSGKARAGLLFGLWGLATKLAAALGVGLAFGALALAGFDPNIDNSTTSIALLALLYGLAPILLKLASIALIWKLPAGLADSEPSSASMADKEIAHEENISAADRQHLAARRLHHHAT